MQELAKDRQVVLTAVKQESRLPGSRSPLWGAQRFWGTAQEAHRVVSPFARGLKQRHHEIDTFSVELGPTGFCHSLVNFRWSSPYSLD